MNKPELVKTVARNSEMNVKDAEKVILEFINVIGDTVKKGEKVMIYGFGTFYVRKREERVYVNPSTGKDRKISATMIPNFRPGKNFKNKVGGAIESE